MTMEFVQKAKINTDDFWYDLFDHGRIEPDLLLRNQEDINKVEAAIEVLKDFKKSAEKARTDIPQDESLWTRQLLEAIRPNSTAAEAR